MTKVAGNYEYEVDAGGNAIISKYYGAEEHVSVPSSLDGAPVKEVGSTAFYSNSRVKSIELPHGLVAIGVHTFRNCTNLEHIAIPDTLSSVESNPFVGCEKLIISISSQHPFFYFRNEMLYRRDNQNLVLCPANNRNENIVIFPETKRIGNYAFSSCSWLKSIILPDNLTTIGEHAFELCKNLKAPVFPDGLEIIESCAFSGCWSFTSINLPGNITSLGPGSFSSCTSLESAVLPEKLTAFTSDVFSRCENLTSIKVSERSTTLCVEEGVLFNKDKSSLLLYPPAKGLETYAIPPGTDSIADGAFSASIHLKYIGLPDSLKTIGNSSFYGCKNLESINFPADLKSIGYDAFSGCTSIKSVMLPKKIKEIHIRTFADCTGLVNVVLPEGLESIANAAFTGCSSISSIAFPDSLKTLCGFSGCTGIKHISLPKQLKYIGGYAFSDCSNLSSISIPEGLIDIRYFAFSNCTGLTSISLPNSLEGIDTEAFSGCTGLTSFILPGNLKFIRDKAFAGCSSLSSITLPASIKSVTKTAFPKNNQLVLTVIKNSPMEEWAKKNNYRYVYCSQDNDFSGAEHKNASAREINSDDTKILNMVFQDIQRISDYTTKKGSTGKVSNKSENGTDAQQELMRLMEGNVIGYGIYFHMIFTSGVVEQMDKEKAEWLRFSINNPSLREVLGIDLTVLNRLTSQGSAADAVLFCASMFRDKRIHPQVVRLFNKVLDTEEEQKEGFAKVFEYIAHMFDIDYVVPTNNNHTSSAKGLAEHKALGSQDSEGNDGEVHLNDDILKYYSGVHHTGNQSVKVIIVQDFTIDIPKNMMFSMDDTVIKKTDNEKKFLTAFSEEDNIDFSNTDSGNICFTIDSVSVYKVFACDVRNRDIKNLSKHEAAKNGKPVVIAQDSDHLFVYYQQLAENEFSYQIMVNNFQYDGKLKFSKKCKMTKQEKKAFLLDICMSVHYVSPEIFAKLSLVDDNLKKYDITFAENKSTRIYDEITLLLPDNYDALPGKPGEEPVLNVQCKNGLINFDTPSEADASLITLKPLESDFSDYNFEDFETRASLYETIDDAGAWESEGEFPTTLRINRRCIIAYNDIFYEDNSIDFSVIVITKLGMRSIEIHFQCDNANNIRMSSLNARVIVTRWLNTFQIGGEIESMKPSEKPIVPTFAAATPSAGQYWHYAKLLKTQGAFPGTSNIIHVVNAGGTEFACCTIQDSVEPFVEGSKALKDEMKYSSAAVNNYTCHELSTEMRRLFRVSEETFNTNHDRECEIENRMLRRAYMLSALKSFAWTLGSWAKDSGKGASEIAENELIAIGEYIQKKGWLNYTSDSYYSGLCNHSDLHVIYLSDQSLAVHKDTIEPKLECASLNMLRDDLYELEPAMRKIHALLSRNRDRSKPLEGTLADVLQAWCVLALAAVEPFWTEDGPTTCWFTQITDGDMNAQLSAPHVLPDRKGKFKHAQKASDIAPDVSGKNFVSSKSDKDDYGREIIQFGTYEQGKGKIPIDWLILKREDNRMLILSRFALDSRAYGGKNWPECELRTWLNDEFYRIAFSTREKAMIIPVTNKNMTAGNDGTLLPQELQPDSDTEDKVFLLNAEEAKEALPTDKERVAKATQYAQQQGAEIRTGGSCHWWLRGPGFWMWAARIDANGSGNRWGDNADDVCVRPAMWLRLSQTEESGKSVYLRSEPTDNDAEKLMDSSLQQVSADYIDYDYNDHIRFVLSTDFSFSREVNDDGKETCSIVTGEYTDENGDIAHSFKCGILCIKPEIDAITPSQRRDLLNEAAERMEFTKRAMVSHDPEMLFGTKEVSISIFSSAIKMIIVMFLVQTSSEEVAGLLSTISLSDDDPNKLADSFSSLITIAKSMRINNKSLPLSDVTSTRLIKELAPEFIGQIEADVTPNINISIGNKTRSYKYTDDGLKRIDTASESEIEPDEDLTPEISLSYGKVKESTDAIGEKASGRRSARRKSQPTTDDNDAFKQTDIPKGTRVIIKNSWSIIIPEGYIYSTDPKKIGGRQLVFMLDDGHTPMFDPPFDATENFSVIGQYYDSPYMTLDSEQAEVFKSQNDLVGESIVVVDTPSLYVSYYIFTDTKDLTCYRITILTPRSVSGAQAFFNRKGTLTQRKKKVLSWMKSIQPVYDEYGNKIKVAKTEDEAVKTPNKRSTAKNTKASSSPFPTATPDVSAYWHYESLGEVRSRLNTVPGVTVNVNVSGAEFRGIRVPLAENTRHQIVAFLDDSESHLAGYSCHNTAGRLAELFRVDPDVFDSGHDRESEIRELLIQKAYMVSALRSFAWTLGNYAESKSVAPSDISYPVLENIGEFIKSRNWINFEQDSHFSCLCAGGDLHNLYVLDQTDGFALRNELLEERVQTENSLRKLLNLEDTIPQMKFDAPDDNEAGLNNLSVQSLPELRKDLSALEPVMVTIHDHLERYRDRTQELTGSLADVLYAWCVFAVCAEYTFYTSDGPTFLSFTHPEKQMIFDPRIGLIRKVDEDRADEIWNEKRATFSDTVVSIEGTGYENRNDHIEDVRVGDKLVLKADYNNPYYKPVAVEVFDRKGRTLGYIQSPFSPTLAAIASAIDQITAIVESVTPLSKRTNRAKFALMDISLKKTDNTTSASNPTDDQSKDLSNFMAGLEDVKSSLSDSREVLNKYQQQQEEKEKQAKADEKEKAARDKKRRSAPKEDRDLSELYFVLKNEENLISAGVPRDEELFDMYETDFPSYTKEAFNKALDTLRQEMKLPDRRLHYEELFKKIELQRRYQLSTQSLFHLLRWFDYDRIAKQAFEWTKHLYSAEEAKQILKLLQHDVEGVRQQHYDAIVPFGNDCKDFKKVCTSLRVSVQETDKVKNYDENTFFQQKVGSNVATLEVFSGALMMATGKIPRSMAWAWGVQPDMVWKEAIRNKVHDQREVKGNDALKIAEQARELYTRRIVTMLLPYEITQKTGAGKDEKKPLIAEQKSESLKKETGTPPTPSNAGQQRLQQIASLKSEIASLNSDLNDLTGWFKGRQRRELTERIEVKKAELKRLEQQ